MVVCWQGAADDDPREKHRDDDEDVENRSGDRKAPDELLLNEWHEYSSADEAEGDPQPRGARVGPKEFRVLAPPHASADDGSDYDAEQRPTNEDRYCERER